MNTFKLALLPFLACTFAGNALADHRTLLADKPAGNWAAECYPIGNGRLGAMDFGGVAKQVVQFNEVSLWGGANNWDGGYDMRDTGFGGYRNFGEFIVEFAKSNEAKISSPSGHADGNGQTIANTVDGKPGNKWCVESPGDAVSWQASLPAPQAVSTYTLTSAEDSPARDPQEWVLAGSNDGKNWLTLDKRKLDGPFAKRGETREFAIAKPGAYRHYRFTFVPKDADHFQVAAIALGDVSLTASAKNQRVPADYRRELDIGNGIHRTTFTEGGVKYAREAFASRPAQAMVFRYTADGAGKLSGRISLKSAQKNAPTAADESGLRFEGELANKLRFAGALRVLPTGGSVRADGDIIIFENCDALTVLLGARTDYKPDYAAGWRTGVAPAPIVAADLAAAAKASVDSLRAAHTADLEKLLDRATIDIGSTPADIAALPTAERKKLYAAGGTDPDLEEMMFGYGRYLLASSSRPGDLPANLQGLWNNSNTPPWAADYHNNINVQMNYWAAETTNLSECHRPLIDYVVAQSEACRVATRKAFGAKTRGWTARTSQGISGSNGWEWNIPASAWYATHAFEHWAFTQDRAYLQKTAYPLLKEICEMWEDRLKPLTADGANFHTPDRSANRAELKGIKAGTLVVPDGWSPEHGPREDGVMHDQQLIWELFEDYLVAARALGVDADYQKKVADMQSRLLPNKIGKWGQLQEWVFDRDNPDDQHRHTSHLFAVYPGRQISREKTPELASAAMLSLRSRSGNYGQNKDKPFTVDSTVGDSRQSWAWPWRCAMWARFGEGEKSAIMVRGLLTHNTTDNLFAKASGVFQMDGNFGIPAAMTEMLLQSHAGEISLLPAIPAAWGKSGSFTGLRARGGHTVDCAWKEGKVTTFRIRSATPTTVKVRVNGVLREVRTEPETK